MDPWKSLRDRLAEGPRAEDEVYTYAEGPQEGQVALWTLRARADYLELLLAERDMLEDQIDAAHEQLDLLVGSEPESDLVERLMALVEEES
jgi:hypothetical protein